MEGAIAPSYTVLITNRLTKIVITSLTRPVEIGLLQSLGSA